MGAGASARCSDTSCPSKSRLADRLIDEGGQVEILMSEFSVIREGGKGNPPRQVHGEALLVRAAQNGDPRAFNEIVCAHQEAAFRLAFRMLGDGEAASDVTQEAFISAYRHIGMFRGGSLHCWLMRIVTNACYDLLRKEKRQRASSLDALEAEWGDAVTARTAVAPASPEELVERHELNDVIQQGLARLPFEQRITVVLADIEEYPDEQIAEITRANVGTVKSRLSRGRASLRSFLVSQEGLLPTKYQRGRASPGSSRFPPATNSR